MLRFILAFMISTTAMAYNDIRFDARPTREQLRVAEMFMTNPGEVVRINSKLRKTFNTESFNVGLASKLETFDGMAERIDAAMITMFNQTDAVLRRFNRHELADQIRSEYLATYLNWMTCRMESCKELGDHAALSVWLDSVHDRLEKALGEYWCKFFHFHDMFILNYSIPVVWEPGLYDQDEYLDHFSGHMVGRFRWNHHGLAGVVAYWTSYGACIAGTTGTGALPFACSPISEAIEHVFDRRIAPPIGKRIWQNNQ